VCFESDTGVVRKFRQAEVIDLSDFKGKKVPSTISAGEITMKIVSLRETGPDGTVFSSANTAGPFKGCFRPRHPVLLKQAPPHYPAEAKYRRISGTAKMWVLINEVGKVEAVRSLGTADSLLQAASQEAVQQWSYSPATCNGEPVQYESVITINYDLRP
jgi:TonB family protein